MRRFRAGDVVRHVRTRKEWRAEDVLQNHPGGVPLVIHADGSTFADYLELARRPVQIGDVLTKPVECVAVGADDGRFGSSAFTAKRLPTKHTLGWEIHDILIGAAGITHADGTPIDLPPTLTKREGFDGVRLPAPDGGSFRVIAHPAAPPGGMLISEEALSNTLLDAAKMLASESGSRVIFGLDRAAEPSRLADTGELPPLFGGVFEEDDIKDLARALFETDLEVIAFVGRMSETKFTDALGNTREYQGARYDLGMDIAWERDEVGARTRYMERAREVIDHLRGGR